MGIHISLLAQEVLEIQFRQGVLTGWGLVTMFNFVIFRNGTGRVGDVRILIS